MAAIEVDHFSFAYPSGMKAVTDVSFSVAPGDCVALLGPNGAGKSSLLFCLSAIFRGTGTIRICGNEIRKGAIDAVRRQIGFVFQNPDDQLYMPTVIENVTLRLINDGLARDAAQQEGLRVLDRFRLAQQAERRVDDLSQGQRKAVALAAALITKPQILLLDEPSSGLDSRSRRTLVDLLELHEGVKIVATHDLELTAEIADRILLLDQGSLREDWTRDQLLANPSALDKYGLLPLPRYISLIGSLLDARR